MGHFAVINFGRHRYGKGIRRLRLDEEGEFNQGVYLGAAETFGGEVTRRRMDLDTQM